MQFAKRGLLSRISVFIVSASFVANSVVPAFAADNLRRISAKGTEAREMGDDMVLTKDGGLTREEVVHLKANLGANAVLGVSATAVRLAAAAKGIPEYEYIARYLGNNPNRMDFTNEDFLKAIRRIMITSNVMNGGKHGSWSTDIQEWMLAAGFGEEMPFWQRLEMVNQTVGALTKIIQSPEELTRILGREIKQGFSTSVGDEGGYTPIFKGNEEALKLMAAAIKKAGYEGKVRIAIDAASSEFFDEDLQQYILKSEGRSLTSAEWTAQLAEWIRAYDIVSTEDIYAENDWAGWKHGFKIIGDKVLIIGDDLTVTNVELLKKAIAENDEAINSILIKINQNGSISGTLEVIQYALSHGITAAISHRSGETEDSFISHLVIASCLFEMKPNPRTGKMPMVLLKTGGFRRTDRIVKYNEILRVEADLERSIRGQKIEGFVPVQLSPTRIIPGFSPTTIIDVYALEIYDSRGNPTTEAFMQLNNGLKMGNPVPSGASTGTRESVELRDSEVVKNKPHWITPELVDRIMPGLTVDQARKTLASRVGGKGVQIAVDNVNHLIAPLIKDAYIDVAKINSLNDLKNFDSIMFDLEVKLAKKEAKRLATAKDGGEVVAIVGGTGDMGKALADRLRLAGVEVLIGSRKANPAQGILANAEAVKQADVVVFAVPAQHVESTVSDLAQYLKKDAIVLSIAAPFKPVDRVLTYTPPQGYVSAAQQVQAIINEKVPEKNIRVVSAGIQSVPAEWMANTAVQLNQNIIVSGDEKTCSLACEKVLNKINPGLKPVISGKLEECCNVEALTPRIVASKKELLAAGSRSVEELVAFVKEKGTAVSTQEIVNFNRVKLDPALRQRYADQRTLNTDIAIIKNSKLSAEEKEVVAVGLRRYGDIIGETDQNQMQQVKGGLARFDIDLAETKAVVSLPGDIGGVVDAVKEVENKSGALVFSAEAILKNAGTISQLRGIREKELPVRVIAWADKPSDAIALELMGVGEVADIKQATLEKVISELESSSGIKADQTIVVGFEGEIRLPSAKGATVLNLKAPQLAKQGENDSYINAMPLVIARALAMIFKGEAARMYEELSVAYLSEGKITTDQLKELNNLATEFFDVPLVKVGVNEEANKGQVAYETIVKAI